MPQSWHRKQRRLKAVRVKTDRNFEQRLAAAKANSDLLMEAAFARARAAK